MTSNQSQKTHSPKIAIAGFGFVGQALYASINNIENVVIYDKYKTKNEIDDIFKCEFIFVCLPTPMDIKSGQQDITELNEILSLLIEAGFKGTVIIKSTVLYSNIAPWLSQLNIVINPEFLNQNSAPDDFANQNMIVLGGNAMHTCLVRNLYAQCFNLPEGVNYQLMSAAEACNFKYLHNIYHAYQVLFWNYAHQLTGNSRKYVALYEKLYGRKPILSQMCTDGEPGYGGACFPKDVNAMQSGKPHLLTEFMCQFNKQLRPEVEPKNINSSFSPPQGGDVSSVRTSAQAIDRGGNNHSNATNDK